MANPIAEINLGRLVHNYRLIKDHVGNAEVLAVVKADGYGHGAVPVSQALEKAGDAAQDRMNDVTGGMLNKLNIPGM